MEQNGVFYRRKRLFDYIVAGCLDKKVLEELLPEGKPHEFEKQLWDYKKELPTLPDNLKPSKTLRDEFNYKLSEVIKDAVSFYNSYGGYLLIGVADRPRKVVGFNGTFDCDEFNKRIKAVTGHEIDCHYITHVLLIGKDKYNIGLLYIPKREDRSSPAQFKRSSYASKTGKFAFQKGDIYFRDGSECKAARTAEDFSFLCAQGCRQISLSDSGYPCKIIDNNLGDRDPGFIKFIGREEYLAILWKWLFDKYMPIKLLTGLGGVGKTTIAREFVEEIIRSAPIPYERIVWLSAKQQFFTAIMGEYKLATRVDFYNLSSLLISILEEMGWPSEHIDEEWTREELMDKVIETLTQFPVFLIIDDIDSLDLPEQHDVFQTISLLLAQTISKSEIASRALLTARLDLGSAPNQHITVKGLKYKEFVEYVTIASQNIGLKLRLDAKSKPMKNFHKVTDGSPTFAGSILKLLATGDSLNSVLNEWKGSVGEEVRNFAFRKELNNLTDSQFRTLFAGCILRETSLIELRQITASNETLLRDDISELKQYHLISLGGELPSGGSRLIVPNSIRLMTDLIKEKIQDPKWIEKQCAKFRAGTPRLEDKVGMVIHRVVAHWKSFDYEEALEVARWGNNKFRDNAALKCLLGRAYMNLVPPSPRKADKMFRRSYELDFSRPELFELWVSAKSLLNDWVGIIEVAKYANEKLGKDSYLFVRIESYGKVAEAANAVGNYALAAEYYLEAGREIDNALKADTYIARWNDILEFREIYYESYIQAVDRGVTIPRDYIETWLAVWDLYKANHISIKLIVFGVNRLGDWWKGVLERRHYSQKTKNLFEIQITRISEIIHILSQKEQIPEDQLEYIEKQLDRYKTCIDDYNH